MKLLIAVIRPDKLEAVQEALKARLDENDNYRMTVQAVEGHGRQHGQPEFFRGQEVRSNLVRKFQISLGLNDKYVEPAIEAICEAARSKDGAPGDGKIFVVPLEECVRIRTGERGGEAI